MSHKKEIIIVSLIVVAAFLYRTLPYIHAVFTPYGVQYLCPDPWYQMRLVDNMLVNFPHPLWHDPYALFPDGAAVGYRPILIWMISGLTLLISGGHPWAGLADTVGAWLPPVLGSLFIILVYMIGKVMFRRVSVGIIAAVLVAFLPTELLHRSLLGFTDHHILETVFSTLALLFLALAWAKNKAWYGIPAGISLGIYMLNWQGAPLFAGVFMGGFVLSFLIAYARYPGHGWLHDPKWQAGIYCFLLGFIISIPILPLTLSPKEFTIITIAIGVVPLLLIVLGSIIRRRAVYFGVLGALVAIACAVVYREAPWVYEFIVYQLRGTFWGFGTTIQEAMPLTLSAVLVVYGFVFFMGWAGIVYALKYKVDLPFVIWSIVITLATIGQRRWGYYSAVTTCLLAAFLLVYLGRYLEETWRSWILGVTVVALLLTVLPGAIGMFGEQPLMTKDWEDALHWVRDNTPPPFSDSNVYYELKTDEKPSYAVISWWDYGHWIIRDARRVPMSSPTQQETRMAYMFFIAQSEEEADRAIEGYNVRYIIIDEDMVMGKFYAMVLKSGQTSISMDYWYNSIAYRLFYGLQVGKYQAVFVTPTVKVFERMTENELP